jgi:hypothetical protein
MHRALGAPTTRLEHEQRLAEWLRALIESAPPSGRCDHRSTLRTTGRFAGPTTTSQTSRSAMRGLDELAAAGIGKFPLIRVFRERTGLAPTRCRSPTASVRPANYSKPAR